MSRVLSIRMPLLLLLLAMSSQALKRKHAARSLLFHGSCRERCGYHDYCDKPLQLCRPCLLLCSPGYVTGGEECRRDCPGYCTWAKKHNKQTNCESRAAPPSTESPEDPLSRPTRLTPTSAPSFAPAFYVMSAVFGVFLVCVIVTLVVLLVRRKNGRCGRCDRRKGYDNPPAQHAQV